ncbi:MAG: hypothetical protein SPJ16_02745 [Helicobacter sp.]|uniref:hypothetical protein n=1 Tax=Helicobacter sp. TaxID=218 RepID=UPI002A909770|nr:hypothetical protein [Helicobacter sp.]MDY5950100.1 hypothetical protein [Helicobacter sp.]
MKTLGYHNDTKTQKAKKCFCESLHLLEFLDTFSYNSTEFFLAAAKHSQKDLGINQCEFEELLQDSISKLNNLRILRKARVYVKQIFISKQTQGQFMFFQWLKGLYGLDHSAI